MMGRRECLPDDRTKPQKLRLEKLRLYDGDYDKGGAYWGAGIRGSALWCAWNDETEIFIRSHTRDDAKREVRGYLPSATFYR